ncbi:hypothetical protein J4N46_11475 [Capnocytophaga sp. Marseille-Q4570]|jgi:putative secreted protein|uniref:tRNA (Guanine-N1)-methyltransferase n=1 Tax=Capnocytophaga bilenii TaxID=2819369 RepID=A0ABS3Q0B5_9FLAO|nr:hypothetical protein [Capnocytophaga bilenii]MBO1885015.1 hypothetical protein [Capnocytophaga bilenii]
MKKIIIISLSILALHTAVAQDSTATRHSQSAQSAQQEYYQRNQRTQNAPMGVVAAQEEMKPTTLEGVFQQLVDKSGAWQNFKMLDRAKLATFQRSMADTINAIRGQLSTQKQAVATHLQNIKELNDKITELQTTLDQTKDQNDSVNFFGVLLSKGVYSTIMWVIVLILAGLLAFYIYKYTNSNVITKNSINELGELQQEYENYRKAAIEREQKVRRQLQDEINKHR